MYQYHANTMRELHIGRQGENAVRQVLFDISDWAAELGTGTSELIYQRSWREDPYPVIVGRDGNTIVWTITERETEYPYRNGRCELRYYVADRDGVAKSRVWTTFVEPSISTPSGDPPEEERGWFDQVIAAGAEAKSYAESAKSDADRAETAAVRQPYPNAQTGTWWVWDADSGEYKDSGVKATGSGSGIGYEIGHGLKVEHNVLLVDTAQNVEQDNTLPITSAAVHTTVGNIEILLKTI